MFINIFDFNLQVESSRLHKQPTYWEQTGQHSISLKLPSPKQSPKMSRYPSAHGHTPSYRSMTSSSSAYPSVLDSRRVDMDLGLSVSICELSVFILICWLCSGSSWWKDIFLPVGIQHWQRVLLTLLQSLYWPSAEVQLPSCHCWGWQSCRIILSS